MIHQVKGIVRNAAAISVVLSTGCLYLPAQTNTGGGKVIQGFNALDYRLQKPAPNEYFDNKRFGDHLFITVEGAPTLTHRSEGQLFGSPDLGARCGVSVGDWFTPVHGLKIGLNAGGRKEHGIRKHLFGGISVDYLMNLSALAHKYDPERKIEFIGVIGAEYQRRFRSDNPGNVFGGHIGLQTRFNVTPSTFIYIEPRLSLYNDAVNSRSSWQKYDWEGVLTVGFGYRISPLAKRFRSTLDSKYALDNTFYGFGVAGNFLVDNNFKSFKNMIGVNGSIYIGTWASTISGWRLMATAGSFGLKNSGHPKYSVLEADYLLNINSVLNGFNPENRFNTNLIIGPALSMTSRRLTKINLGASVGIQGVIDLTRNLQFVIEPKALIFNRHFAASGHRANVLGSLSIGFQYRLGRYKDKVTTYDFSTVTEDFLASNKLFMTFGAGLLCRNSSWNRNAGAWFGFGRWFSPVSAWRLTVGADYFHRMPRFGDVTLNADYMLSLTSMFCGYNPDRVFDLIASGGLHGGVARYNGGNHGVYGLQGSIQARFNVSENVDIFVEPQLKATYAKGYANSLDKGIRVMAGFNYKFGNNRKERGATAGSGPDDRPRYANYVALTGGPGIFSEGVRHWWADKICGGIDIVYGRQFTHVSSIQAGIGYDFANHPRAKGIAIGNIHADYLLDITQLFDCDPDRKFHISAFAGIGMGWSNYHMNSAGLAAQGGMQFKWAISKQVDILAEPRATLWQPRVCNIPGNTTHFVGASKLMLGLSYKF